MPDSVKDGVGVPWVVTVKAPAAFSTNAAPGALVIEGAWVFVNAKLDDGLVPPVVATLTNTWNAPGIKLPVKDGANANPDDVVVTTVDVVPPENVPLGPFDGAANVTGTPETGLPK